MFKEKNIIYLYTALFWIKLYIVQRLFFDIPVNGWLDEVIILFGTLSSAALLSVVILLLSRKRMHFVFFLASSIGSALVISNVIYFRFFNDFITIAVLTQTGNVSTLKHSLLSQIRFPADLLIFLDTIVIGFIYFKKKLQINLSGPPKFKKIAVLTIVFFLCVSLNFAAANDSQVNSPGSLQPDNTDVVKHAGIYNYQLLDAGTFFHLKTIKWFTDEDDLKGIEEQIDSTYYEQSSEYFGIAENKNIFLISMESLQSFVIGTEVAGEEVTPFLNELVEDSWYFSDLYHQTAHGKTSDSEFIVETSLYPLDTSSVFFNYANNTYFTLAQDLDEIGYTTAVFHANNKEFWNRDKMYDTIGYDHFYDLDSFHTTEENSIGWGLKDKEFFAQSMPYVLDLPEPFFAKWITLTNHHPFVIDEYEDWIEQIPTDDDVVSGYFGTVRYTDEAIAHLFDLLKAKGLYEDSIFILYGDHYGLAKSHYEALGEVLGKQEITEDQHVLLQQVPLIIHIPGEESFVDDRVAGQIDIKPTIRHLLGIERSAETIEFGFPLVVEERPAFAVLRDGTFITDDIIYTNDHCYLRETGELTDDEACLQYSELARFQLDMSDEIIYGDLLRFTE